MAPVTYDITYTVVARMSEAGLNPDYSGTGAQGDPGAQRSTLDEAELKSQLEKLIGEINLQRGGTTLAVQSVTEQE